MNRTAAQKIVDDIIDDKIRADLNGMLVELNHQPANAEQIIENYNQRVSGHVRDHALATDFVVKNFQEQT